MVLRWMIPVLAAAAPQALIAAELPVHVALGCDTEELTLSLRGESGTLYVSGAEMPMARARSASGVKFESVDDPETHVWTRGDEAMVRIAGQDLHACHVARVSRITEGAWTLASLDGVPLEGGAHDLTFDADGVLSGHGGCGQLEGSWRLADDDALRIEAVVARAEACTPGAATREEELLAALAAVTELRFSPEGQLELLAGDVTRITATH